MAKKTYGKTASGKPITDELVDGLADKAEAGYDVDETLRRRGGRPPIGSAAASVVRPPPAPAPPQAHQAGRERPRDPPPRGAAGAPPNAPRPQPRAPPPPRPPPEERSRVHGNATRCCGPCSSALGPPDRADRGDRAQVLDQHPVDGEPALA